MDVSNILADICYGLEECDVPHQNGHYGDPCKTEEKELFVTWKCGEMDQLNWY